MKNFTFHNTTKLIFGRDTIGQIGGEICAGGYKKVFLIAGAGSIKKNGVYEQAILSLKRAKIEWIEAWGIQPNPVLSKIYEIIELAKRSKVDALLAIGGGSVIDSAKAVACGFYMKDVWQAFEERSAVTKALPLYTVLTLSSTGTEMNQYAVVTNENEKKKWNIAGPALYPKVSIIDPSIQASLPWNQTVNGALDAISHIYEYYFLGGESETTLALDESLCRSIVFLTDRLRINPDNYESRANLAWAATLALNGISGIGQEGGDWASHGIEHAISALNPEIAHGAGLGVVFPAWIAYCQDTNPPIFRRWAKNIWEADTIEGGIAAMKAKIRTWAGQTTLDELGIRESQVEAIAQNALEFGLTGSVKRLTKRDITSILNLALPKKD